MLGGCLHRISLGEVTSVATQIAIALDIIIPLLARLRISKTHTLHLSLGGDIHQRRAKSAIAIKVHALAKAERVTLARGHLIDQACTHVKQTRITFVIRRRQRHFMRYIVGRERQRCIIQIQCVGTIPVARRRGRRDITHSIRMAKDIRRHQRQSPRKALRHATRKRVGITARSIIKIIYRRIIICRCAIQRQSRILITRHKEDIFARALHCQIAEYGIMQSLCI